MAITANINQIIKKDKSMLRTVFLISFFLQFLLADNILIGKYDRVDFPQLELKNIRAKIDSGAKTSSLHCGYIKRLDGNRVIFEVLDNSHKKYKKNRYIFPIKRIAKIRSSNGMQEERFVVLIKTVIFNKVYDVEYSLRNRRKMSFPILLGREFLRQGFLIDVNKQYLSHSQKFKK